MNNKELVRTTYSKNDVVILLNDISGRIEAQDTNQRERLIQSGVHYSEMLPLEYKPSNDYINIYNKSLREMSRTTAEYCSILAEKLYNKHNGKFVIISLARAGTPVGILVKRYIRIKYNINIPHYSISIIRGKGIDLNALRFIRDTCKDEYGVSHFQFLDGWTGKGAILNQLVEAVSKLKKDSPEWGDLSDDLAVLSDPANICETCGTHRDFLIPSACLNGIISGLISRTILRNDIIDVNAGDFHGAVYFEELEEEDRSNQFIDTVTNYFNETIDNKFYREETSSNTRAKTGLAIVKEIAIEFGVQNINFIKPGIGETTRVLLRRVPWKVLINSKNTESTGIEHIIRLCEEKNVPIEYRDIGEYVACGIVKDISSDI